METGRVDIVRDVTFVESQPRATAKEAATEADKADPASHTQEVSVRLEEEEDGID